MTAAIVVQQVGKQFPRYAADRAWTLQETVLRGGWRHRVREHYWALRHVSFTVRPAQTLGVIGANGAGKTTLLRLVGGVGRPDEGQIRIHGRVGALLDLGAGFHGDLTGRENLFVGGVIAGLTRAEVRQRFDDIVRFAELEASIDNPMRTYSTGMRMRLAFAVATHIEPDILLIDEVLSVGDEAFQRKCLRRMEYFKAVGCAILVVSHDMEQIRRMCDEVLWLHQGRPIYLGPPAQAVARYLTAMQDGQVAAAVLGLAEPEPELRQAFASGMDPSP